MHCNANKPASNSVSANTGLSVDMDVASPEGTGFLDSPSVDPKDRAHQEPRQHRINRYKNGSMIKGFSAYDDNYNSFQKQEDNDALEYQRTPIVRKLMWSANPHNNQVQQYGCMPVALSGTLERSRSDNRLSNFAQDILLRAKSNTDTIQKSQTNATQENGSKSVLLLIYAMGMLASSVINSLYFKKMTSAMPNYSAFLNQATSVIYIPIFGCVCLYLFMTYGADGVGGAEVIAFPLYKFAAMGVLDGAGSVLMMIGGTYTTGSSQVVLSQTVIPVTLVTCYLGLNRKYHPYQYIGAIVIMLGVAITKMKSVATDPGASMNVTDKVSYNLVFMASTIPAAFSALYKELAFNDVEMNVNYMQFWVATWQFVVGFLLVPMQSIPLLGPQRVPLSEMPESMKDGFLCLVTGHNSIVTNCGGPNEPQCDNCGVAWMPVFNYCLVNIAYNVFSLLVVKHGGATISFLVSTLRLPLTTICFGCVWIMGEGNTTTVTLWDIAGLVVLFSGLCAYRFGSIEKSRNIPSGMKQIHLYTTTLDADPIIVMVPKTHFKTDMQLRDQLYNRLSVVDPLLNPHTRAMYSQYTPPKIPDQLSDFLPETMLQRYHLPPALPSLSGGVSGAAPWGADYSRNVDAESICSSRSKDPGSETMVSAGQRRSQRQRWMDQLANKYRSNHVAPDMDGHDMPLNNHNNTRKGWLPLKNNGG